MESPSRSPALAWATDGELEPRSPSDPRNDATHPAFDGEVILTQKEITRLYQFKSDEIRQYQEWLLSNNLSREDKESIN